MDEETLAPVFESLFPGNGEKICNAKAMARAFARSPDGLHDFLSAQLEAARRSENAKLAAQLEKLGVRGRSL